MACPGPRRDHATTERLGLLSVDDLYGAVSARARVIGKVARIFFKGTSVRIYKRE
jgi:hypothetical protein